MKKVKDRDSAHEEGPGKLSFKEIMLNQSGNESKTVQYEDELVVGEDNVAITMENEMPTLVFSVKILELIHQSMKLSVIVRLLGKSDYDIVEAPKRRQDHKSR